MRRLVLTAVAGLALVAPAQAATWSAPSPPRGCPVVFGFNDAGRGLAVGGNEASVGQLEEPLQVAGWWAELAPGGELIRTTNLPFEPTSLAFAGTDVFTAAGYVGKAGRLQPPYREYALVGSLSNGLGAAHRLGKVSYRQLFVAPQVTVSSAGRAVAVYGGRRMYHGKPVTEIRLATRRFSKETLIARGRDVDGLQLAGNARGQVAFAWRSGKAVFARVLTASGRLLPQQRLGSTERATTIKVAVAESGEALVAWGALPRPVGATKVRVAFKAPGVRFSPARMLDANASGGFMSAVDLQAAFAGGRAIVAWGARQNDKTSVRVQLLGLEGAPLARTTVSPPDVTAWLSGLAADRSGTIVVAWMTGGGELVSYASILADGATAFADPERISGPEFPWAGDAARVAIDPLSRTILAIGPTSPVGCWYSARVP